MPKQLSKDISSAAKDTKKFIEQHPVNGNNTAFLAGKVGVSRNVLQEAFKAKYGTSIGTYKLQVRMAAAKQHLTNGKSIKEVAIILAYSSPSSFSNAFRNYFRESPTEWLQDVR